MSEYFQKKLKNLTVLQLLLEKGLCQFDPFPVFPFVISFFNQRIDAAINKCFVIFCKDGNKI